MGNLTMGGNGKTPFTILLAKALHLRGAKVAVSHRGYKGKYEKETRLISDEKSILDDAQDAGDEALLIAQNLLGIPVIVGRNRKAAIRYLERTIKPTIIILDDSFQHLKVQHNFDFVLLNAQTPFGNGLVAPAGKLREPVSVLKFSDCLVMNDQTDAPRLSTRIQKFHKPVISTEYEIESIISYRDNDGIFKDKIGEVVLISGIGNPSSFEASVTRIGIPIVAHYTFPDHHDYDLEKDIRPILDNFPNSTIITTEKDYVKLSRFSINARIYYAKLKVMVKERDIFDSLLYTFIKDSEK